MVQKGRARIAFDTRRAKTDESCLLDWLLQGPDCNNGLRRMIFRSRKGPYTVTADLKNMLHYIAVSGHLHTFLRFFCIRTMIRKGHLLNTCHVFILWVWPRALQGQTSQFHTLLEQSLHYQENSGSLRNISRLISVKADQSEIIYYKIVLIHRNIFEFNRSMLYHRALCY